MSAIEMKLPENLTVAHAHALHDEFEELLNKKNIDQLVVHAAGVNRADTAGLQLMLAVVQATNERQISLSWDKPSENLIQVAVTLGIRDALGLH